MARNMTALFEHIPTKDGRPVLRVSNLSEIPIQKETRQQLFVSIAETQPFGPVDAAKALNLEPAKDMLERLTSNVSRDGSDKQSSKSSNKNNNSQSSTEPGKSPRAFYADRLEKDRFRYRLTDASVGRVGYHYGAAKDDQKSGRKVKYLPNGVPTYPPPEHS